MDINYVAVGERPDSPSASYLSFLSGNRIRISLDFSNQPLWRDVARAFFVTVRTGTAYWEMKMTKVYFVCQYCISMINESWRRSTGNFSRETIRMYKIRANIAKIGWRESMNLWQMTKNVKNSVEKRKFLRLYLIKDNRKNKFGWKIVNFLGKCLEKIIGYLAYREMLFYITKPWT